MWIHSTNNFVRRALNNNCNVSMVRTPPPQQASMPQALVWIKRFGWRGGGGVMVAVHLNFTIIRSPLPEAPEVPWNAPAHVEQMVLMWLQDSHTHTSCRPALYTHWGLVTEINTQSKHRERERERGRESKEMDGERAAGYLYRRQRRAKFILLRDSVLLRLRGKQTRMSGDVRVPLQPRFPAAIRFVSSE